MPMEITTINLKWIFVDVNCYLVKTGDGYILIDTGLSNRRADLEKALENAGCQPGNLKLIIVTHGDVDHIGNCAYLRKKYGVRIAVHPGESEAVEHGDMLSNRKKRNIFSRMISRIVFLFFGLKKSDRFKPDLLIEDGFNLTGFGFNATIIHIPGHSQGSVGILTADGDLFCGDLFVNGEKPETNTIIDNPVELDTSVSRLKGLGVKTVYPGHGRPFPIEKYF